MDTTTTERLTNTTKDKGIEHSIREDPKQNPTGT